ncbi:hypothetical protein HDU87_004833 [Geranomyces variabilis]|uniref:Uncharacterized protein n=1 Tax=Geranomyces variabilis TaxID=109894 RepID=A0AAD5TI45_9FUNG|nr:hypothetical protein HDU87_004833 [Geranomyces variabilis]
MVQFQDATVPSAATTAALLAAVPALGVATRFFDAIMPDHGAPPHQRKTAIKMLAMSSFRFSCICLDLYNAREFWQNWSRPENLSQEWWNLALFNAAVYTSMIIYEMAAYEATATTWIHHLTVGLAQASLLVHLNVPPLFPHFIYLYRMGTLFGSPMSFVVGYYVLEKNEKQTMLRKKRILRLGLAQYQISCGVAALACLAYSISNFGNMSNGQRALAMMCMAGMIPDQFTYFSAVNRWQRRLSAELERRLSSPLADIKRRISVSISPKIKTFGEGIKRRMSLSPTSPPMSPVNPEFSPVTPQSFTFPEPRPLSRPASAINRRRPVHEVAEVDVGR